MDNFFRSEEMVLCQIFIPTEAAYFVISELGEIGIVQFRDLNSQVNFLQRNFTRDVLRCYEMESKLKYITSQVKEAKIKIYHSLENTKASLTPNEITDLEAHIAEAETEISRLIKNGDKLYNYLIQLKEFKSVLLKAEEFLKKRDEIFGLGDGFNTSTDFLTIPGMDQLNFITGVVDKEKASTFETLLWRVSKGNAYFKSEDFSEPIIDRATGIKQYKTIFVVCAHGEKLFEQLLKLAEGFRASLYVCPSSQEERQRLLESIARRMDDLEFVISQTDAYRQKFLISVANQLQYWTVMVRKIKAIYHIFNYMNMDVTGRCLIGECWISYNDIPVVNKALADGWTSTITLPPFLITIETDETPPTYYKTNKFTCAFQHLIDVYGMASYREMNPAPYTIVSFPFLFAVMFGDLGHAIIMTMFAGMMIRREKEIELAPTKGEIFNIFFTGRYLILLMGLFSTYTGFIYNDMFSIPLNLFGTRWFVDYNQTTVVENQELELDPAQNYRGTPYPFGVDPIWMFADNKIVLLNSFKMKVAIILGVFHMILGLLINISNFSYFKTHHDIYLEFLPKIILLCCLFLWLVVMMFLKWILYSTKNTDSRFGTACAPSILVLFIDMILCKKHHATYLNCDAYLFKYQEEIQYGLLLIAGLTVSVLLFGKPLHLFYERKRRIRTKSENKEITENVDNTFKDVVHLKNEKKTQDFSEIIIIQAIDTVEYVLGTVSHTASYLRLWALSLAHAQLSEVLWDRLLNIGLAMPGYVGAVSTFIIFMAWAFFTIAILVLMEGLSAFLHTLRLHWVEFMSKFYEGCGYPFEPFSFKTIVEGDYVHEE